MLVGQVKVVEQPPASEEGLLDALQFDVEADRLRLGVRRHRHRPRRRDRHGARVEDESITVAPVTSAHPLLKECVAALLPTQPGECARCLVSGAGPAVATGALDAVVAARRVRPAGRRAAPAVPARLVGQPAA